MLNCLELPKLISENLIWAYKIVYVKNVILYWLEHTWGLLALNVVTNNAFFDIFVQVHHHGIHGIALLASLGKKFQGLG